MDRRNLSILSRFKESDLTLKFTRTRCIMWTRRRLATGQFFGDGLSKLSGHRWTSTPLRSWNDAISLSSTFHGIADEIMLLYNAERSAAPSIYSFSLRGSTLKNDESSRDIRRRMQVRDAAIGNWKKQTQTSV